MSAADPVRGWFNVLIGFVAILMAGLLATIFFWLGFAMFLAGLWVVLSAKRYFQPHRLASPSTPTRVNRRKEEMREKPPAPTQRKQHMIRVVTVVAMLFTLAGFALATAGSVFSGTVTNSGYNHSSLSAAGTIYDSGGLTVSYGPHANAGGCTASPSAQTGATASVFVGGSCVNNDWYAQFTLTAPSVTAATLYKDHFYVSESATASSGTIEVDLTPAATGSFTLDIYLDLGTASPPATIATVTATATGS